MQYVYDRMAKKNHCILVISIEFAGNSLYFIISFILLNVWESVYADIRILFQSSFNKKSLWDFKYVLIIKLYVKSCTVFVEVSLMECVKNLSWV